MTYHSGNECIRSYVLVCSQMFSEPTLYIDEDTHHQARVITRNLVRDYDKRGRSVRSYPRKGTRTGKQVALPTIKIIITERYKSLNLFVTFQFNSYTQRPVLQQVAANII